MTNAADDFDALFDEVSAQRAAEPAPAPAAAPAPAVIAEDDFDALFDSVSASTAVPVPAAPAAAAEPATAEAAPAHGEAADPVDPSDKPMFERLGGIVRLLHDSLRELGYDKALTEASSQIVDAQDRLEYVATLTEQAANKVLNTLDEGMPAQDVLSKKAKDMDGRWTALFDGKLSLEEFKALAGSAAFQTIVVSAHAERSITAFDFGVLDFVAKPFSRERLHKALQRYTDRAGPAAARAASLAVKKRGALEWIAMAEIDHVQADGHYSNIVLRSGEQCFHDLAIDKLMALLPPHFLRVHRSYIVNSLGFKRLRIGAGGKYALDTQTSTGIPVSRSSYPMLKQRLLG